MVCKDVNFFAGIKAPSGCRLSLNCKGLLMDITFAVPISAFVGTRVFEFCGIFFNPWITFCSTCYITNSHLASKRGASRCANTLATLSCCSPKDFNKLLVG